MAVFAPMKKPPISNADYQRIFRTAYSILERDTPDLTKACYHINSIGALILRKHYGIDARPVVGFAAYMLDEKTRFIVIFGDLAEQVIDREGPNSHCWITTGDWHIDFMAPLFPELTKAANYPKCEPRMFCKPAHLGKNSLDDLKRAGDFFEWPHEEKTKSHLTEVFGKPAFQDLADIVCQWFRKPPAPMLKSIPIGTQKGEIYEVRLSDIRMIGSW